MPFQIKARWLICFKLLKLDKMFDFEMKCVWLFWSVSFLITKMFFYKTDLTNLETWLLRFEQFSSLGLLLLCSNWNFYCYECGMIYLGISVLYPFAPIPNVPYYSGLFGVCVRKLEDRMRMEYLKWDYLESKGNSTRDPKNVIASVG